LEDTLAAGRSASSVHRQPQRPAAVPPSVGVPGEGFIQAQNGLRNKTIR